MATVLLAHAKPVIIAFVFIISLLSFIAKRLDKKLPQSTKDRFNQWINAQVLRWQRVTGDSIFEAWRKVLRWTAAAIAVLGVAISVVAIFMTFRGAIEWDLSAATALTAVAFSAGFYYAMSAHSYAQVVSRFVMIMTGLFIIWICLIAAYDALQKIRRPATDKELQAARQHWEDEHRSEDTEGGSSIDKTAPKYAALTNLIGDLWFLLIPISLLLCLTCLLPTVSVGIARLGVGGWYFSVWWLSHYPGGAWAGLILVVTSTSEILELLGKLV